jgi:hypothetical protein
MNNFFEKIEPNLSKYMKPGRYIGGEKNECIKDLKKVKTRICLLFPDVYEMGMSNLGIQICFHLKQKQASKTLILSEYHCHTKDFIQMPSTLWILQESL